MQRRFRRADVEARLRELLSARVLSDGSRGFFHVDNFTFGQPLVLSDEAALWAIPRYHIVCSATVPTRDPTMVAEARAAGRFWEIDTGHDLMITEPEFVADALLQVAADQSR